jgi:phosphate/sulfate permease
MKTFLLILASLIAIPVILFGLAILFFTIAEWFVANPQTRQIMEKADEVFEKLIPSSRIIKTRPPMVPVGDVSFYVTSKPLVYEVLDTKKTIVVPKGFVTDLASVPFYFWAVLPRDGVYMLPAIIHDYLYWDQRCGRSEADDVLFLAMKEYEIDAARRWIIYLGVRLGGSFSWRTNRGLKHEGQTRYVSGSFVDKLEDLPPSANESMADVLRKAKSEGGLVFNDNSNPTIEQACLAAAQLS